MSTSPASTGPAGAHFESQVGAHYLLSMLIDSDPRGLPGVAIDRIEFQRRAEGYPLDDIVVHAHDNQGCATLLEIQVKRSVTFAPSDRVFREVVGQVAEASRRPEFWTTNHQLAVAISRGSQKVAGPYQDVLTWARWLDSAQTFMGRLNRSGAANDPMRTFVDTFRENLRVAQAPHDDATVHRLLSRFQILQFDYGAPGSQSDAWDNERSSQALDDDDRPRHRDFHRRLVELAIETAAGGGDLTRDRLIKRLYKGSFRLAGRRGYREARRSLAEASRHTLDDIEDRVGGHTLIRAERISAVRAALAQGRYVEIRGDAGVGKSALLKHFAEQLSAEAPIIVLSHGRTPAGGWTQMKAVFGLEGTAHDLLIDMAGSGSTTIFLDGLDFFSQEERNTVRDLVREAAKIRGIALIVTARSDFGRGDEPNWLPDRALATLRPTDVHVDELNETEVNEIVSAAPKLGPLLAASHPARNVARNLFRLSRLAAYPDNERPRTEIDLAERWWQTADGESDGRRDRSRLLLHLAEQAIAGIEPTDSSGYPSRAVDALVESRTLRDLGGERMMFHHDIYRDWAIANVLYSRPDTQRQISLDRAVPAALVRGVELAARMSLERCADDSNWQALLAEASRDEAHHSWRRAVLLAPVRSEIAIDLLNRISGCLLADEARVLRDLIKAVMAVDAVPAREFAAPGVDPNIIPKDLYLPGGPSWLPLIVWLLSVDPQLPAVMVPEVAALYFVWCLRDQSLITPKLVSWFYRRLTEIEDAHYSDHIHQEPFGGALSNYDVDLLETNIRACFLSYCHHDPSLAVKYLQSLETRRRFYSLTANVLEKPGSLARAAPEKLADFTIASLLPRKREDSLLSPRRRAFEHQSLFMQPSPNLGPFLDLLSHAPTVGRKLVDQIVDHAVSFYGNLADTSETLTISFVDGSRTFSRLDSYGWAKSFHCPEAVVTTALMALEEWGHRRIQKGDSINAVLADVLAPSSTAAAYLLVAVDLLHRHWPQSREVAVPFAACPELLCLDYQLNTRLEAGQYNGARPFSLVDLLGHYATSQPFEQRDRLASSLEAAGDRLGQYGECSDLADPAFMVRHALNVLDPNNWNIVDQPTGRLRYSSPEVEKKHLERQRNDLNRQYLPYMIAMAVLDQSQSSPELAATATEWAKGQGSAKDHWKVVAAAALAMRDGDDDLRSRSETWAIEAFKDASQTDQIVAIVENNPVAIALVGWAHLLTRCDTKYGRQAVLGLCARSDGAAVPGFRAVVDVLAAIDERLPTAILRTAFATCIRPSDVEGSREIEIPISDDAIDSELSWMDGNGGEPTWPTFPLEQSHVRPVNQRFDEISLTESDEIESRPPRQLQERVDIQYAARWIESVSDLDVSAHPWLRGLTETYARWTAVANGDDPDDTMRFNQGMYEWNVAYFKLLAHCMPGLEPVDMDEYALNLITSLPDRPFFDVTEQFILNIDKLYFGRLGVNERQAVHIRSVLVRRLMQSREWRRWDDGSMQVETNLRRAIAALFLANGYSQPPRCLLRYEDADYCGPLLPTLQPIAGRVGCYPVTLSLFEINPRPAHLEFIVEAAEAWMRTRSVDSMFWIDYDAGKRLCSLIEVIRQQHPHLLHPGGPLRDRVDHLIAALVSAGVTEAAQLEKALSRDPTQER